MNSMLIVCFVLASIAIIYLCNYLPISLVGMIPFIKPKHNFSNNLKEPIPDYYLSRNWYEIASLANKKCFGKADLFFVHRTTFLSRKGWNASLGNWYLNWITWKYSVKIQVNMFRGITRIYAPKYRQATLYSFYDANQNGEQALDLAYEDVKAAFLHYLQNHNNGRPIILSGHSQGTHHLERLLKELFDTNESLRQQLVCAYLLAMPIAKNPFQNIFPCRNSTDIGCFVSWSTFGVGAHPLYFKGQYDDALCTNPLDWRHNNPAIVCSGATSEGRTYFLNFKKKNKISVSVERGVLQISNPGLGYLRLREKDYVSVDYHLFYEEIRRNASARINTHLNLKNTHE